MKQVIVTGATGFIGARLVRELIDNDIYVIAPVRDELRAREQFFGGEDPCDGTHLRLLTYYSEEYESLCSEGLQIDAFYHLAWGGVAPEKKNDRAIQVKNIDFALEMLEWADSLKADRFIATGTVAEYTFCEEVMDVYAKQTPNDLYGASKTAAHYMLETWARSLDMPFNWVVIPSTFGEGRRDNNILTYTIRTLLAGERPSYGYLTQMWDFLYVAEVVRALRLIGEKGHAGKIYAIGSGVYKPLREYVEAIRDIIDPKLPLGIGDRPALSDKAFSSCVNIAELTADTGFVPGISFEEGIRKTVEYFKREENQ